MRVYLFILFCLLILVHSCRLEEEAERVYNERRLERVVELPPIRETQPPVVIEPSASLQGFSFFPFFPLFFLSFLFLFSDLFLFLVSFNFFHHSHQATTTNGPNSQKKTSKLLPPPLLLLLPPPPLPPSPPPPKKEKPSQKKKKKLETNIFK